MAKEPKDEVRPLTESCKTALHLRTDCAAIDRRGIAEMLFDIAMTPLFGVHIRRVRGQPLHHYLRMHRNILLDDHGPMRAEPIPDDDHRPGDVPLEMLQGHQHIRGPDGMGKVALVNLAGQRQANDRGQLTAFAHTPQNGRLSPRGPGRAGLGAKREPGFIDEDDCRASAASLFLMRGQSCVSQAWTRSSSRSRAYTAGCCGLQPSAVSRRAR
jgi:hypothetical protein